MPRTHLSLPCQFADVLQTRALLTYIKRVYFPYVLQEPELFVEADITCGLWVHSLPTSVAAGPQSERLGMAITISHLGLLPDALSALQSIIDKTGQNICLPFLPLLSCSRIRLGTSPTSFCRLSTWRLGQFEGSAIPVWRSWASALYIEQMKPSGASNDTADGLHGMIQEIPACRNCAAREQ